jgi:membrane protease YdiL (CAAX protease family)
MAGAGFVSLRPARNLGLHADAQGAASSVGFVLDRRWIKEVAWGTLFGMGSMLAAVAMIWAIGGVRLELNPARSLASLGYGFYMFVFVALFEETLFRGFAFRECRAPPKSGLQSTSALRR